MGSSYNYTSKYRLPSPQRTSDVKLATTDLPALTTAVEAAISTASEDARATAVADPSLVKTDDKRLPIVPDDPELSVAVVGSQGRRTWLEADGAGAPTSRAREAIGVTQDEGEPLLAVSDGVRRVDLLDRDGTLSPRLLRYSRRDGMIPAAAGGVRSDGVATATITRGKALEPVSGTDDTERLERLIRSVSEDGGGTIVLPPGNTFATVVLAPGVSLVGSGQKVTNLIAPNGSNRSVIRMSAVSGVGKNYRSRVADLSIRGNWYNQKGVTVHRGSIDNYGTAQHGIWVTQSGVSSPADEGFDAHHDIHNVRISDVRNVAIMARSTPGEVRYRNIVAERCGIGFVSGPDSFWNSCTVAEPEFWGVLNIHGSTTWTNVKVFRAGALVTEGSTGGTNYIRRAISGWRLVGYGNQTTIAACSSQNNGGHGIETLNGSGANVQMQVDGNNLISGFPQLPFNYSGTTHGGMQKYAADGVTEGIINPEDFVGAYLDGSNGVFNLNSLTGSEQSAGSYVGWQKHAVAFSTPTEAWPAAGTGNMVTVGHHSNIESVRPAGDILRGGRTNKNRVVGNGMLLDEVTV